MSRHEVVVETTIPAPPERVWKVVKDPRRFPEWMSHVSKVVMHGSGPLKKGSRFAVHTTLGSHTLVADVEVTHYTEPEILGWRNLENRLDGKEFDMITDGATEMVLTEEKGGTFVKGTIAFVPHGLKAKLGAALFVNSKVKPQLHQSLDRLKALVLKEK